MKWDNIIVLSDLHLCEGAHSENEDFFYDQEFAALLKSYEDKNTHLVLNGDIVDFLQVTSKGAFKNISYNEERFGLGTTPQKSAYKLKVVQRAHPEFFEALANFLKAGNDVTILPGNHDVEFFWKSVQKQWLKGVAKFCSKKVASKTRFEPWCLHIPKVVYIEHGHQYDPVNAFDFPLCPVLPSNTNLLDLPLGSFLVRYFFNLLEDSDPLADNFRPPTKYVSLMVRKDPLYVFKVLAKYVPCLFRTWIKSLTMFTKHEINHVANRNKAIFKEVSKDQQIPYPFLKQIQNLQDRSIMHRPFFWFNAFKSHLWTRSVPLELPTALKIKRLLDVKYVVMGHTHHAFESQGYLNSGTWTQMVTHHGYYDIGKRLTYVHITKESAQLRTWD